MSDIPQLKSKEQIFGTIVDAVISRSEVLDDLNQGSVLDSILMAVAEMGFSLTADVIQMITAMSIERSGGDALKRIANDERVPVNSATEATGFIRVKDLSFTKIDDKIFPGLPAPVAGTNLIYVIDAEDFPQSGAIYLGRGTSSVEGPIPYTSVTPVPNASNPDYWEIQLSTPTTKFHNLGESVILAQGGNRTIAAGTQAQTPQGVSSEAIAFTTSMPATILDGEVEVTQVPVIASQAGTIGNVTRGAITEILGLSFAASCFNDEPFSDAVDDDTDEFLRDRIKEFRQLRARGTEGAIRAAAIGVTSPDEKKRVVTSNVKRQPVAEQILIIDDGTGYQPIDAGVGLEQVVDQALGNEVDFQMTNPMLVKASVTTLLQQPFDVQGGQTLAIEMQGENVPVHTFRADDFRVFRAATAYEISASINASSQNLPYYARVVDGGTRVQIISKIRNEIRVDESSTANEGLQFPVNRVYTLRLYKNDVALYQDGLDAAVESAPQPNWGQIFTGDRISYIVDNTIQITSPITDAAFQKYGPTLTVNRSQPIGIWAQVLNDLMPGVEVSVVNQNLRFKSRSGKSGAAAIQIITDDTSASVGSSFFPSAALQSEASGLSSDYTLNLKTGQLQLNTPLAVNDKMTAGSRFTRAKIETSAFTSTTISLGNEGQLFMTVDGSAEFVPLTVNLGVGITLELASAAGAWSAVTAYTAGDYVTDAGLTYQALVDVAADAGNPAPATAPAQWVLADSSEVAIHAQGANSLVDAFTNSATGDWLILWADAIDVLANSFSAVNRGSFRVRRKIGGNCLVIVNPTAVGETKVISDISRITSLRSTAPVQSVTFPITGPNAIDTIEKLRDAFLSGFNGVLATIVNGRVRVESETLDDSISELFIAAASESMRNTLGLAVGAYRAVPSHNGFVASDVEEATGMPTFKILEIDSASNITDNTFQSSDYLVQADGTQNELVQFIGPATGFTDNPDSATNKDTAIQVREFNPATNILTFKPRPATLSDEPTDTLLTPSKSKAENDSFILRQGLVLDADDTLSFVIDGDVDTKAFLSKVSRRVRLTSANPPSQFSATDDESPLSLNHPSTFRDFDFKDFKVWIRARTEVQGLRFKSTVFGPAGERNGVSFKYPLEGEQEISHIWEQGPVSAVTILLGSGPERALGVGDAWDAETGFTVGSPTVNGNVEEAVFTYSPGVGDQPNFLGAGGPQVDDVVVIGDGTGFTARNKGRFKITDVSSTTFTAQAPVGTFEADNVPVFSIRYPDANSSGMPAGQGTGTITTNIPHQIIQGQKIGLYGGNPSEYIGAFVVIQVIDSYRFRVAFAAVDSDQVVSVERTVGVGTFTATIEVGTSLGNIVPGSLVRVSDVSIGASTFNGLFTASVGTAGTTLVLTVPAPAHVPSASLNATLRQRVSGLSTLTIGAHPHVSGDFVTVAGVGSGYDGPAQVLATTATTISYLNAGVDEAQTATAGTVATAYGEGSFVSSGGNIYRSTVITSAIPTVITDWTQVQNVAVTVAGGRVDAQASTLGNLSRILQSQDNLRFFPVVSTREDVETYAQTALAEFFEVEALAPTTDPVDANSQSFVGAGYTGSGSISIQPILGSRDRWVTFPALTVYEKGADVTFVLAASGNSLRTDLHNQKLRIVDLDNSSGVTRARVRTQRQALPSEVALSISADWTVTQEVVGMGRGESYVRNYVQNTTPNPSDFILKKDLPDLESNEIAYLIATTAEQLARLIGRLANSGLSNVAEVGTAQSMQTLQVKTNTFGRGGSVQLSGGKANSISAAVTGSGAVRNNQAGLDILLDLKAPFVVGSYARIENTVVQNKNINVQPTTTIEILANLPATGQTTIRSNQPIFRTERVPTSNFDSRSWKLERHGKFMCLRQSAGASAQLTENVQEGDWLVFQAPMQITSTPSLVERTAEGMAIITTLAAHTITPGQKFLISGIENDGNSFNGSFIANETTATTITFVNPGTVVAQQAALGSLRTLVRTNPLAGGNLGVFQVVRTYGDAAWFENELGTETMFTNPQANVINAFSYDSVLPGDKAIFGGNVLGIENIGKYPVSDDILLMSSTEIIVDAPMVSKSPTTLGIQFTNFAIEEASPLNLIKQVVSSSVSANNNEFAFIGFDSANLVSRVSPSLGGVMSSMAKLAASQGTNTGLDAYRYYRGLLRATYDTIYGDPTDPSKPGVAASGTDIDIQPPIIRRVFVDVTIRIKSGVPFTEILDAVKSAVAGYVNSRGVGQPVSISQVISAIQRVEGVLAVPTVTTSPLAQTGLINVQPNEVSKILNSSADVTVSIVNG